MAAADPSGPGHGHNASTATTSGQSSDCAATSSASKRKFDTDDSELEMKRNRVQDFNVWSEVEQEADGNTGDDAAMSAENEDASGDISDCSHHTAVLVGEDNDSSTDSCNDDQHLSRKDQRKKNKRRARAISTSLDQDMTHSFRIQNREDLRKTTVGESGTKDGEWQEVTRKKKTTSAASSFKSLPEPKVFQYPVLLEDLGTGSDHYTNYGATTNKIWQMNKCGKIISQRRCKQPNKWMLECGTQTQQMNISLMKKVQTPKGFIDVKVEIPVATTEGVIFPIDKRLSEEDIEELICEGGLCQPPVKKVLRIYKKPSPESDKEKTTAVRIVFITHDLPSEIKVGTEYYKVEPFRRQVTSCAKCYKLDHRASECPRRVARCPRGCPVAHARGVQECPRIERKDWRCVNCNMTGHSAAYLGCPARKNLMRAQELRALHYMPLGIALKQVRSDREELLKSAAVPSPSTPRRTSDTNSRPTSKAPFSFADAVKINSDSHFPVLSDTISTKKVPARSESVLQSIWDTSSQVTSQSTVKSNVISKAPPSDKSTKDSVPATTSTSSSTPANDSLGALMQYMDRKVNQILKSTQEQFQVLNDKVEQLREERRVQLDTVEVIVQKNRDKPHDAVNSLGFQLVDSLRKAVSGDTAAFLATLCSLAPVQSTSVLSTPPRLSRDLEAAVLNLLGLSTDSKHG
jgi:hypothetical protein